MYVILLLGMRFNVIGYIKPLQNGGKILLFVIKPFPGDFTSERNG